MEHVGVFDRAWASSMSCVGGGIVIRFKIRKKIMIV